MKSGQLVWNQFCVARAVCAGAPSYWKMYPLGNQNSLTKNWPYYCLQTLCHRWRH